METTALKATGTATPLTLTLIRAGDVRIEGDDGDQDHAVDRDPLGAQPGPDLLPRAPPRPG